MSISNSFPEPSEQLLMPMDPSHFQAELQRYAKVGYYTRGLITKYENDQPAIVANLRMLTNFIRLPEANISQAAMYVNEHFYYLGGLVGLDVMKLEQGASFVASLYDDQADSIPVPNLSGADNSDEKRLIMARSMMEVSDCGYSLAEPYHDIIERLADELCVSDADHGPYLRRGFGLTMFMAGQVIKRNVALDAAADFGLMKCEADQAVHGNWDDAFVELLPGAN
ncbi:MAG: hypothetical protein ABI602_00330 [Candidatus Saccharibacteria bacterium]